MEKKFSLVKFIPAIVVEYVSTGATSLRVSTCLFDDLASARKALNHMIFIYDDDSDYNVVRYSIFRKVFEL